MKKQTVANLVLLWITIYPFCWFDKQSICYETSKQKKIITQILIVCCYTQINVIVTSRLWRRECAKVAWGQEPLFQHFRQNVISTGVSCTALTSWCKWSWSKAREKLSIKPSGNRLWHTVFKRFASVPSMLWWYSRLGLNCACVKWFGFTMEKLSNISFCLKLKMAN